MHVRQTHKSKLTSSTMYNNSCNHNNEDRAFLFQCPPEHIKELNAVKAAFAISHLYFDGWIYLFLSNKKYDVAETIAKLKRRADMEQHVFRHYTITPTFQASMRAGVVQYVGDDKAGRPVLYFNTARDHPTASERAERQANFDIFLSWAVRLQRSNPTCGVTWLINQHHASLLRNTDLVFQKDMALRTSKFYPGTVARMFLCNMNSALTFVMKPLLRQLPKAISETIFMYSQNDLKNGKLLDVIDYHVLPIAMGGGNDCDHPSNYDWFAIQVENYYRRCVHALNNHISIKEMEMMEEFHVDVHGRPIVETVKNTYEKEKNDKNSKIDNKWEKTNKAIKLDQTKATIHNITNTDKIDKNEMEEFKPSENKEKEELQWSPPQRLQEEEQLTQSPFSVTEIQTSNANTSKMKSITSTLASAAHQQTFIINNNNKNLLSLLVDDDNDDYNSDDSNLKTPIEVCSSASDDDDEHETDMVKHSHEIKNNQKESSTYKKDMKSIISKTRNEKVSNVFEIADNNKGVDKTKKAIDVSINKNVNNDNQQSNTSAAIVSPNDHVHDNVHLNHMSHSLLQTPLSVAFGEDQVVITSNRYKSEVRWNDRHVADELPSDTCYQSKTTKNVLATSEENDNTDIDATKKNYQNKKIEEGVTNTEGSTREFSLHDSFASGLITTPINDLLSFNTHEHEHSNSYNNDNSYDNENVIKVQETKTKEDVDSDNKVKEQKREFANNAAINNNNKSCPTYNNMRQKSTLVECANSKEYHEFVSFYISYKVIEIAKHIKCTKSNEINTLKQNWNAFFDLCYTLQHPVEHIVHVLHGQTINKTQGGSTTSSSNRNDSGNECCTNSIEYLVELIKAHVSDFTLLIQHLLLLSVPSSRVLYILSNGCISATSTPMVEVHCSCTDNQEQKNDRIIEKETKKESIQQRKEHRNKTNEEQSMLENTSKENILVCSFLEPLQVDCTSADNLLLSLQASTVVFVEQCEQMIELHKTHERLLRRTLLTWSNKLSRDEYVIRLVQRANTLWNELVPWFRQYIECKVNMAIASFMAYYGLLIVHGKIDTTSEWYKNLFTSILHFREIHRRSWLFHLLPPFTFTSINKSESHNTNTTKISSQFLPQSKENIMQEEEEEESEEEPCFHVNAPSVTELLSKSHLPESIEGLCTLIVMIETSLKATLQQLKNITSMAAQLQVEDDLASPTFPTTRDANSKITTNTNTNTKIKNSSFFGKTMQNLSSCNSNSNNNDSFANSTQLSQKNNNVSIQSDNYYGNNNETKSSSKSSAIPPILYTNHGIVDRYLEYSKARISIPFESQSMGLSPVEMIISEQIKACAFLTAAETPLKEFLFTIASLYVLSSSSCSAVSSSPLLAEHTQLQIPRIKENQAGQKQRNEQELNFEQYEKEIQITDASNDCKTDEYSENTFATSCLIADDTNVKMDCTDQNDMQISDEAIHKENDLVHVKVTNENNELVKGNYDNHNTDICKTLTSHTKENEHLDVMQRALIKEEDHSTENNNENTVDDKNNKTQFSTEANKIQIACKWYLTSELEKVHYALKEEQSQRRICTALAMAAYHVQCNGTIYGYGGTEDSDNCINTFYTHNNSENSTVDKNSSDQIDCKYSKQGKAIMNTNSECKNACKELTEQRATSVESNNVDNNYTNEISVKISSSLDNNKYNEWPSYGFGLALQLMEMLAYLTWHDESKQSEQIQHYEEKQQLGYYEESLLEVNVDDRNNDNKFEEIDSNDLQERQHQLETNNNEEEELLSSTSLIESPSTIHKEDKENVFIYRSSSSNNNNSNNTHHNRKNGNSTNTFMNTETSKNELLHDVQVLIENTRHANEYALPVAEAKRQYIFMTFTN